MKKTRNWIPVLAFLALGAMFLKMPETPNVFSLLSCKACTTSSDPYLPLLGAAYFTGIIVVFLLFPEFPSPRFARGGLVWALLLAIALTYLSLPSWCIVCSIAHACNILIWVLWKGYHDPHAKSSNFKERLCLVLFAPLAVAGLLSSVNLTFMAYGFKLKNKIMFSLQHGDTLPSFSMPIAGSDRIVTNADITQSNRTIINFVSPNCPYCEEQLAILRTLMPELSKDSYRFINVSPALPSELLENAPFAEWVEDKEGRLRELFRVSGFPTLFIVGKNAKIIRMIPGVPDQFKTYFLSSLGE